MPPEPSEPGASVEREALATLDSLGLPWYLTGSWALAAYAEPRMTRDVDVVVAASPADYETRIRPAFESDFLVNDPIDLGGRWIGGIIHRREIVRIDLIFGRSDAWSARAMERRRSMDQPVLGRVWTISPEDLVLAKLEWSQGTSELQLRDVRSLIRLREDLDWAYLERYASVLGVRDRLEAVRDG